jgi:hypothetical protein
MWRQERRLRYALKARQSSTEVGEATLGRSKVVVSQIQCPAKQEASVSVARYTGSQRHGLARLGSAHLSIGRVPRAVSFIHAMLQELISK